MTVQVVFDDVVRVGSGNAAVANATGASVLAGKPTAELDVLTIPLRPGLPHGAYSVRWSIVSNDGHLERGVLAFAVGLGEPRPHSVLGAAVPLTWTDLVLRSLYYLGLLAAGGIVIFALAVRAIARHGRSSGRSRRSSSSDCSPCSWAGAGSCTPRRRGPATYSSSRSRSWLALAGGAAAALAPGAAACSSALPAPPSLALLAAPTLAGHALDPSQPRFLSVPADLLHIALGRGLGRRAARARGRRARARARRRRRATSGPPRFVGRARRRRAARGERRRAGRDGAVGRLAALVDVVRADDPREVGALRWLARARATSAGAGSRSCASSSS